MPTVPHRTIRKIAFDIYRTLGAPDEVARMVSDYQVETNLQGHDSHGCVAIPRFVSDIKSGKIVPDAVPEIVRDAGLDDEGVDTFGALAESYQVE